MRPWIVALVPTLLLALGVPAQAAPDAKKLHDERCTACHIRLMGGDGSGVYTRPDRKVTSLAGLRKQVAYCVAHTDAPWFPEEADAVAAYLNQRYYKFK